MSPEIQDIIEGEAVALGLSTRRMPSGAGHDAMIFGKKVPSAMIFVPSRGGVSHSPSEWTSKEQCGNGAEVLLRTVIALASKPDNSLPAARKNPAGA
jgi:N-carbamoyl-L-amino-acid hydrolase